MDNLKAVSRTEFEEFLANYKGDYEPHCWNETTIYCDFNRPSKHPIGSGERINDALIAKTMLPFWDAPDEYYIIDENN